MSTQSVLFDLDGTLLDTAPDLICALNTIRVEDALPELPARLLRPVVSKGSNALVEAGFGLSTTDLRFEEIRSRFLDEYSRNIAVQTRLFPGMEEVIKKLERMGIPWGVVTNKPSDLTFPVLEQLDLLDRCSCVVCGDTLKERKPHPEPVLHACRQMGCDVRKSLYVGDAERDIISGKSAGAITLVALFGYLGEADSPELWEADGLVGSPEEIIGWVQMN